MFVDLSDLTKFHRIGVAVSGGSDSMALLHYLNANSKALKFSIVAINVEHGIRGKSSISDSQFVASYCKDNAIPLLSYSVDAPSHSKENKLSIEQSARILRYECFFDAIANGKCDVVATAHHLKDNMETVLINLFRGTGIKGLTGITDYGDKIIRPFISLSKADIENYIKENSIPFVLDETNLSSDYTRNFFRLNVIPKIEEVFPEAEKCVFRLSLLTKKEDEFLDKEAEKLLSETEDGFTLPVNADEVLLSRAVIIALKKSGVEKDWEKKHIDDVITLSKKENGKRINLLCGISAYKEYDKIYLSSKTADEKTVIPFTTNEFTFYGKTYGVKKADLNVDLKSGLYFDIDKIPAGAVIRSKCDGDFFTKFNGGTKSLSDYFTDKKIPLRERKTIPLIAKESEVLAIFNVAISDKIKVDNSTEKIYKL